LRGFIKSLAVYISKVNEYTNEEKEQIEYSLRILVFEISKMLGVIILFSIAGYPVQAVTAVITMTVVKPFIGGFHEDSQIKCFIADLIITGSIVYLGTCVNINYISKIILNGSSLYCIWNQAPVINSKMQLTRNDLIKRNRTVGLCLTALFALLSIVLFRYAVVSNIIVWTLVFQSLFMFNKR
jgi:accessory gene regulator B